MVPKSISTFFRVCMLLASGVGEMEEVWINPTVQLLVFYNGVSSPERNLAKPALVNTVGSEMRLKKSGEREICSISELYNFASVETLRHQFLPRKTNQTKPNNKMGGGVEGKCQRILVWDVNFQVPRSILMKSI